MDKITRNDLKPCPFCGSQPYEASCDRLIKIGCDVCDYHMHFNGIVQSEINTGVPIHYRDGTISDTEWYDKDAHKKADEKWNARSYEE